MATKKELQDQLKQKYGINKNISQSLSSEDCQNLLSVLQHESSVLNLVTSFSQKNSDLGKNNAHYGRLRYQAEQQLQKAQTEYEALQRSVQDAESRNTQLREKRGHLDKEQEALQQRIRELTGYNQQLRGTVQTLESKNQDLTDANTELKKDNKALKNLVDQIRLKLALDIKKLMRYEDSEIRKAAARLFKWTQG